jgi:putative protease
MLELSAPAGSPEAVRAAVQNGADAVILGFEAFHSSKNLGFFRENEFAAAAEYCRIRGVKTYIALDTLVTDSMLEDAVRLADISVSLGADAIIVNDMGLLKTLKTVLPDYPLHAGVKMGIHNLKGVLYAASLGATRVVLPPELSKDEILSICIRSPIDIEVYCHGPLCISYKGQCYMSAFTGHRSCNLEYCGFPCKASFGLGAKADSYPLTLKELSLGAHLLELEQCGVRSVRIEAASKRPEYVAMVTDIFSRSIKNKRTPSEHDMKLLSESFPNPGFSDGYFTKKTGAEMFGTIKYEAKKHSTVLESVKADYMGEERQRVPVNFYGLVQKGMPAKIAVQDARGNTIKVSGAIPGERGDRELSSVSLQTQLYKTNGTPYYCTGVKSMVDKGLTMSTAEISAMRNELLHELSLKRRAILPQRRDVFHPGLKYINREKEPELTVSVTSADQLSSELAGMRPQVIYVPLEELVSAPARITAFWENGKTVICAILPPVIHDGEEQEICTMLKKLKDIHVEEVLVNSIGQIEAARTLGFRVRGNYGLNVTNSQSLKTLKEAGLESATASFELKLSEIRELSKCIDTEMIIYGRIPMMVTENCVIKSALGVCGCDSNSTVRDKHGSAYPVMKSWGCRNTIYSAKKIYLADKLKDINHLGLWGVKLMFTTENARECLQVAQRYFKLAVYEPVSRTRGLYY